MEVDVRVNGKGKWELEGNRREREKWSTNEESGKEGTLDEEWVKKLCTKRDIKKMQVITIEKGENNI